MIEVPSRARLLAMRAEVAFLGLDSVQRGWVRDWRGRFSAKGGGGPAGGGGAAGGGPDTVVPAPHRGRDLIAEGQGEAIAQGAFNAAAALPRPEGASELAGRRLYHGGGVGPHGDEALHHIASQQGFEGKARSVSRAEMDARVAHGDMEMFRGVRAKEGKTAEQIHEQVRSGEAYHGLGFSGNGSYMSSSRSVASGYGTVARYAVHRDAKVVDYRDLQDEQARYIRSVGESSVQGRVFADPGRYAAARGYDVIHWRRGEEVGKAAGVEDEFIVINRSALLAEVGS